MRTSDTSRPVAAAAPATPAADDEAPTAKRRSPVPAVDGRAAAEPDVLPGAKARFVAEERSVAPNATIRGPASLSVPARPSFVTLDAVSLIDFAKNSISGGSFNATVPMRPGSAKFPCGKDEPADLLIRDGTVCSIDAQLVPSERGVQLTHVDLKFEPTLKMQNPGIFFGGALGSALAKVEITRIGFDDDGQMGVFGTVKLPFMSLKPLEDFTKEAKLPKFDLHLEAFLTPGRAPTLPDMPTLDPKQLLAVIGGIIEKATFNLVIDGPKQTVSVGSDGAEILSAEGRGSLKLSGELAESNRVLSGAVAGSLNAGVSVGIELDGNDGSVRADGLTIMQKGGRLLALTSEAQISRIAGPVAVLIGERTHLDAKIAGNINHQLAIRISKEGAVLDHREQCRGDARAHQRDRRRPELQGRPRHTLDCRLQARRAFGGRDWRRSARRGRRARPDHRRRRGGGAGQQTDREERPRLSVRQCGQCRRQRWREGRLRRSALVAVP